MSGCPCGSGVPFVACHGMSRAPIDWRLEAFAYVHNLSAMYPELRPAAEDVLEFAERAGPEVGDDGVIPPELVEEGVALVDERDRRRLVGIYNGRHGDRWKMICRQVQSKPAAERALVASAVRGAIGDRRPPPRELLEELEADEGVDKPAQVLIIALPSALVWSIDEVEEALDELGKEVRFSPLTDKDDDDRMLAAMDRVAVKRWRPLHAERLVWLSDNLAEAASRGGFERIGGLLEDAVEHAAADVHFRSEVAVWLLAKYAIGLSVHAPQPLISAN